MRAFLTILATYVCDNEVPETPNLQATVQDMVRNLDLSQTKSVYRRPYSFATIKPPYWRPPQKPIALVSGPIVWRISQYYVGEITKYDLIITKS